MWVMLMGWHFMCRKPKTISWLSSPPGPRSLSSHLTEKGVVGRTHPSHQKGTHITPQTSHWQELAGAGIIIPAWVSLPSNNTTLWRRLWESAIPLCCTFWFQLWTNFSELNLFVCREIENSCTRYSKIGAMTHSIVCLQNERKKSNF